jgi:signal transduction histidine kinase
MSVSQYASKYDAATAQKKFEKAFEELARLLIWKFRTDDACKDCSRFFYGTHQKDRVIVLGGSLTPEAIKALRAEYEAAHPKPQAPEIDASIRFDCNSEDAKERQRLYGERARRKQFTRLLSSVKDEIARLRHMVNDVLNFGRPAHLAVEKVDIRHLMEETIQLVRPQAEDQDVKVIFEQGHEPIDVIGDAERLKSCLSNITINALQAMPNGGKLSARVRRLDGQVEVTISDTGVGISPESVNKIFEPYFSTKKSGFGLGLAVTKKIVEEHHGSIEVHSQVNQGTTFTLRFPVAGADSERA